jgi:Flp pilus assembly protein TadG
MMFRRCDQRPQGRRGATAVEFAFVAPILFLILFAIIVSAAR